MRRTKRLVHAALLGAVCGVAIGVFLHFERGISWPRVFAQGIPLGVVFMGPSWFLHWRPRPPRRRSALPVDIANSTSRTGLVGRRPGGDR